MIDPRLLADIKQSESCVLHAYEDTEGVWTIGWGHEMQDQSGARAYLIWTQQEADAQLQTDLLSAQAFAEKLTEWPYLDTPCRRNAVIELCFELRSRWLPFIHTREAIRAQNWQGAHDGLLASMWAKQVHSVRADRIANYLLNGVYP